MVYIYLRLIVVSIIALILCIWDAFVCIVKQLVPYKYRIKKDVKGKNILITGSGSGLGKLTAKKFAKLGAHLILVDIDEKNNKQTQDEIIKDGGKAEVFKCDLSDRDEIYAVSDKVKYSIFYSFVMLLLHSYYVIVNLYSDNLKIMLLFMMNS
jgi:FlaA1/EpsC-like NDP-sugar epimerase